MDTIFPPERLEQQHFSFSSNAPFISVQPLVTGVKVPHSFGLQAALFNQRTPILQMTSPAPIIYQRGAPVQEHDLSDAAWVRSWKAKTLWIDYLTAQST